MKQVKLRSMLLAALVAVLAAGVVLFCVRYVVRGGQWAAFPANDHAYQEGRLALGQVLDRNGLVLYDGASGTWAEDGSIRRATLHAVGDRDDNISTSAKAALRQRLVAQHRTDVLHVLPHVAADHTALSVTPTPNTPRSSTAGHTPRRWQRARRSARRRPWRRPCRGSP